MEILQSNFISVDVETSPYFGASGFGSSRCKACVRDLTPHVGRTIYSDVIKVNIKKALQ
jgi:hypothetical protein